MIHHPPQYNSGLVWIGSRAYRGIVSKAGGTGLKLAIGLLVFSYIFASAGASAEKWHHALHEDGDSAHHQCLVTLLQSSQCSGDAEVGLRLIVPHFCDTAMVREAPSYLGRAFQGPHHSRAPPF